MTISSSYSPDSYTGNGATTSFPVTFPFFGTGSGSELRVVERVIATGAETTLAYTTDYTVTGGGGATGTVEAVSAPAATVQWFIFRDTNLLQEIDLVENDPLPSETLENGLDRLTAIAQEQNDSLVEVAFKYPETYTGGASTEMPEPSAGKALKWNSGGTALENSTNDVDQIATDAAASAAAAATSETNAATSETNAAASAAAAAVSETNAAASEAAAAAAAAGWSDVVSITSGTTNIELTDANKYYIIDASAGTVTINMPAVADTDGRTFGFEVLDATNAITIARDGTDTINGVAGDYTSLTGVGDVVHFISIDGAPDDWSARLISRFVVDDVTIQQAGRTISVKSVTPSEVDPEINAQTGTSYTLVLGDAQKSVTMSNASANTLTIPTNASVAFPIATRLDIWMGGTGVTTVQGDTGVTVNGVSAGSLALAQYGGVSILKVGTDEWYLAGGTVA